MSAPRAAATARRSAEKSAASTGPRPASFSDRMTASPTGPAADHHVRPLIAIGDVRCVEADRERLCQGGEIVRNAVWHAVTAHGVDAGERGQPAAIDGGKADTGRAVMAVGEGQAGHPVAGLQAGLRTRTDADDFS